MLKFQIEMKFSPLIANIEFEIGIFRKCEMKQPNFIQVDPHIGDTGLGLQYVPMESLKSSGPFQRVKNWMICSFIWSLMGRITIDPYRYKNGLFYLGTWAFITRRLRNVAPSVPQSIASSPPTTTPMVTESTLSYHSAIHTHLFPLLKASDRRSNNSDSLFTSRPLASRHLEAVFCPVWSRT